MIIAVDTRERLHEFLLLQVYCFTNVFRIPLLDCPGGANWFWTSGQRRIFNNCSSPFVWNPNARANQAFSYSSFCLTEPSGAFGGTENCISFAKSCNSNGAVSGWQDDLCSTGLCSICEMLKFDEQ